MYADDVLLTISFPYKDSSFTSILINDDLKLINDWSASIGLRLNTSKTSFPVTGSSTYLSRCDPLNISIDSVPIASCPVLRVLGLYIDPLLSFQYHVGVKCRAAFICLRKHFPLRHILSISQKLLLSCSLTISLFDYADT